MARPKKGEEHPRPEVAESIGILTSGGIPTNSIARVLNISKDTLYRFYREELDEGRHQANSKVVSTIYQAAVAGENWACSLWVARRMGWKETTVNEHVMTHDDDIAAMEAAAAELANEREQSQASGA